MISTITALGGASSNATDHVTAQELLPDARKISRFSPFSQLTRGRKSIHLQSAIVAITVYYQLIMCPLLVSIQQASPRLKLISFFFHSPWNNDFNLVHIGHSSILLFLLYNQLYVLNKLTQMHKKMLSFVRHFKCNHLVMHDLEQHKSSRLLHKYKYL